MSTTQELRTRIALKYDEYAAWQSSTVKLLPGEIAICKIPGKTTTILENGKEVEVQSAPTVLFKVGDGNSTFSALPWASAKAADVYNWAKAETVELKIDKDAEQNETGRSLVFRTGDTVIQSIDLSGFATDTELSAVDAELSAVDARVTTLEGMFTGDSSVQSQIEALDERLVVVEGGEDEVGSVANAIKVSKDYTDAREVVIKAYVDAAESAANTHTNTEIAKLSAAGGAIAVVTADLTAHTNNKDNPHVVTKAQVGLGNVENKSVAEIKTELAGSVTENNDNFVTGGEVYTKIAAAQTAAEGKVTDLANGAVKENSAAITAIQAEFASEGESVGRVVVLETAVNDHEDRLESIEAFFDAADHDGEDGGLTDALDTLKEIQDYLNGEGNATGGIISRVAAAEDDIEALQATLAKDGTFEKRVAAIEANASNNASDIDSLQELTAGFTDTTIKAALDAVSAQANKGVNDAAAADGKAVAAANAAKGAQDDIDALEIIVSGTDGNGGVKAAAEDAQSRVTAVETRVTQAETDIDALEQIVSTGADSNANLRTAITDLQTLTSGANGNDNLRNDLTTLSNAVNHSDTGLAKTHEIADQNASDIASIKANYVSYDSDNHLLAGANNIIIFNCGNASDDITVTA